MNGYFKKQIEALRQRHEALLQRPNEMQEETNGIIRRYVYPVLTRQHIPWNGVMTSTLPPTLVVWSVSALMLP